MDGYIWGDAEVTYPDWRGTAQLDQRITSRVPGEDPGVEALVGLDHEKWWVVGIDIGGGEHEHWLRLLAVSQDIMPAGGDAFRRIAESNDGEIPVTEFLVHDVDPYAVLKAISHQFALRLRVASTVGVTLRVVDQGDVPEQL